MKTINENITFKRKLYDKLLVWKEKWSNEYALLIEGARRIGKSTLVEEFAKKEYKSYILIDFQKVNKEILDIFETSSADLDTFFFRLQAQREIKLIKGKSLIIFDEVQLYPKARQMIKTLVQDGRYHYIETGSLISLKENIENILIPSEEMKLKMYPLSFEEFCWATNKTLLFDYIRTCFEKKIEMGRAMHTTAMEHFRKYLIIGGMPQAIKKYLITNTYADVNTVKNEILNLYREDINKSKKVNSLKIKAIFDNIPSELSKHDKKFKFSHLNRGSRTKLYDNELYWLGESMIANLAYKSSEPSISLKMNLDSSTVKCYLVDTGLLLTQSLLLENNKEGFEKLLMGKLNINEGMFFENIVAQLLINNYPLFFYTTINESRHKIENDFLINDKGKISLIEVKSSSTNSHKSLDYTYEKFKKHLSKKIIIGIKDYKFFSNVYYYPVYMTELL
ncbi:MAG: AAA family ATPase [Bacillales bacterium]|jgi:predicted AAA+ superfamily ATPase|nr:AAA family ATPase [Bacillales bacterium]